MSLSSVLKNNLLNETYFIPREKQVKVNGIGGIANLLGIIPSCSLTIGDRTIKKCVGIVERLNFDLLLGFYLRIWYYRKH